MASQKSKKMRKANFSHREVMVMLENILENKRTIMASICSDLTNKDKSKVWQIIADKLSSLGAATRTSDEVREKFYNLKREHRARAAARQKTGNGGAIVGKDTELVKGVKESPEVLQAVEVQPLNDVDEAQIPSCQAPVEPPLQENAPAKDKAKQYRPKKQQLLQKELKKRHRTGTEESPAMSEYLESCTTLNRYKTELVKLQILEIKQRMKIGDTTDASTSTSAQ